MRQGPGFRVWVARTVAGRGMALSIAAPTSTAPTPLWRRFWDPDRRVRAEGARPEAC